MFGLDAGMTTLLIICLLAVCAFEFINGFHDTANAVATVIYTKSLKPNFAVAWSGFFNFLGVLLGGISVAMGIVNLLPLNTLIDQNIYHGVALIMSLLLSAIIWNLGTWYFGIPCSSSHTLIGSIFGVGIACMFLPEYSGNIALNWKKVQDVGLSLLVSPFVGFGFAMLLMWILKKTVKYKKFYREPRKKKAPPFWIRSILVLTCTSVSFSHGSNDGQKGVGLVMIILILLVPTHFAINQDKNPQGLLASVNTVEIAMNKIDTNALSLKDKKNYILISEQIDTLQKTLIGKTTFSQIEKSSFFEIRKDILLISQSGKEIFEHKAGEPKLNISKSETSIATKELKKMKEYTEYSPFWVVLMISLSLGIGTMIGWKRIVVTIGEKIGKSHLSYAQGASAEIVAASTIGLSTIMGLPVSTTHVLSSGIAGTMVAHDGHKNLQGGTIKNIAIAWIITLPVTMLLAGGLFLLFRYLIG